MLLATALLVYIVMPNEWRRPRTLLRPPGGPRAFTPAPALADLAHDDPGRTSPPPTT
ncbi:hypothetical protein ACIREM_42690 [Streptomyces shenzhenensis]|uniref:hypothetical protein n=1 Tax=Streptomyces shenzhenensis TaxID=943815 RepID=UPI0038272731